MTPLATQARQARPVVAFPVWGLVRYGLVLLVAAGLLGLAWSQSRPLVPPDRQPVGQLQQLADDFGCQPHWAWDGIHAEGALIRSYTDAAVAHVPLAAAGQYTTWWIAELCQT